MRRGRKWLLSLLPTVALACAMVSAAPAPGAARIDWARARLVTVVAADYRFVPDQLRFRRGVPYRLRLTNRGHELHELSAPKFFRTLVIRDRATLDSDHSELVVQPGEQKNFYFVPMRRGHYDMRCPDHDWAGMTGDITVE